MQGRSLSKQHRPQQMAAYQEGGSLHHHVMPTSVSARKYIRDPSGNSASQLKLSGPIKQLQNKHKQLEV